MKFLVVALSLCLMLKYVLSAECELGDDLLLPGSLMSYPCIDENLGYYLEECKESGDWMPFGEVTEGCVPNRGDVEAPPVKATEDTFKECMRDTEVYPSGTVLSLPCKDEVLGIYLLECKEGGVWGLLGDVVEGCEPFGERPNQQVNPCVQDGETYGIGDIIGLECPPKYSNKFYDAVCTKYGWKERKEQCGEISETSTTPATTPKPWTTTRTWTTKGPHTKRPSGSLSTSRPWTTTKPLTADGQLECKESGVWGLLGDVVGGCKPFEERPNHQVNPCVQDGETYEIGDIIGLECPPKYSNKFYDALCTKHGWKERKEQCGEISETSTTPATTPKPWTTTRTWTTNGPHTKRPSGSLSTPRPWTTTKPLTADGQHNKRTSETWPRKTTVRPRTTMKPSTTRGYFTPRYTKTTATPHTKVPWPKATTTSTTASTTPEPTESYIPRDVFITVSQNVDSGNYEFIPEWLNKLYEAIANQNETLEAAVEVNVNVDNSDSKVNNVHNAPLPKVISNKPIIIPARAPQNMNNERVGNDEYMPPHNDVDHQFSKGMYHVSVKESPSKHSYYYGYNSQNQYWKKK